MILSPYRVMSWGIVVSVVSVVFLMLTGLGESTESSPSKIQKEYPQQIIRQEQQKDGSMSLSTPLAIYQNADGQKLHLIGAVHIGEKAYYEKLTKRLNACDRLLFELVGGENFQRESLLSKKVKKESPLLGLSEAEFNEWNELQKLAKVNEAKKTGLLGMLGGMYGQFAKMIQLATQKDGIDYSSDKFVHADMSLSEMEAAQQAKGESILGIVAAKMFDDLISPPNLSEPNTFAMIRAIQNNNSNVVKEELIKMMANQADDTMRDTVILEGRNDKCLEVFDRERANPELKNKTIGIFYGAAHLKDLHQKVEARGYHLQSVEWLPAWQTEPKK
ncbi:MAG: TraB/GumN family protein [Akkermansia sp.]